MFMCSFTFSRINHLIRRTYCFFPAWNDTVGIAHWYCFEKFGPCITLQESPEILRKLYSEAQSHLKPCVVLFGSHQVSLQTEGSLFSGVSSWLSHSGMLTSAHLCMCPYYCSKHSRRLQEKWFIMTFSQSIFYSSVLTSVLCIWITLLSSQHNSGSASHSLESVNSK